MSATVAPLVPPEKWAAFAEALIDFQSFPGRYSTVAKEPKVLFEHLTGLLAVAAGRPVDGLPEGEDLRSQLQAAARFFVRAAMLRPGTDHYSLMGLAPGFEPAMLREHYRMLMRLTHPDFAAGGEQWPPDAATRINQANDVLGSAERRAVYDQALTAVRTPGSGELALARRPLAQRPVEPDEAKKRWPAVAAAGVSVAVLAFLLWPEKPAHERLASLAQAPAEIPQVAAADAAPARALAPTAADAAQGARETGVARVAPSAPPAPAPGPVVPSTSKAPPEPSAGPTRSSGLAAVKSPVAAGSIGGVSKAAAVPPTVAGSPPAPVSAAQPVAGAAPGVVRPSVPAATVPPTPRPAPAASTSTRPAALPPVVAVARPVPEAPPAKAAAVTPVAPAVAVKTGGGEAVAARPASAASTPLLLAGATSAGGAPVPGRLPATSGVGALANETPAQNPTRPATPAPVVVPVMPASPPAAGGVVPPPPVRPAGAEVPRLDAPRIADVQPLLAQMLSALQTGRGERALAVIDRAFRPGDGSARFLAAYNRAIAGARDIRVGAVQFRSRNVANSLVVDGTIALQSLDNDGPGVTRDLPVRAVFLSRDGQPVLAQLSTGEP